MYVIQYPVFFKGLCFDCVIKNFLIQIMRAFHELKIWYNLMMGRSRIYVSPYIDFFWQQEVKFDFILTK
jgi:hypothetical protein